MAQIQYPKISCVVIGLNCEKTVAACLESILRCSYPNILEIIYVDGGSVDHSVALARGFEKVKVVLKQPPPGKERNAGWRLAKGEWVHFFDSDTLVEKDWITNAVKYIDNKTSAIFGLRSELYPHKNWFHFIADIEWYKPEKEAKFFGGDCLIRRSALEESKGYDESLIWGDDPELAARIRKQGGIILGLPLVMCYHDINMTSLGQYLKRSLLSGYGYAAAGIKIAGVGDKERLLKAFKIFFKVSFFIFFTGISLLPGFHLSALLALLILVYPLSKTLYFKKKFGITLGQAFIYALHCCVVVFPHFLGVCKYLKDSMLKGRVNPCQ